jgi:hypothetical protein
MDQVNISNGIPVTFDMVFDGHGCKCGACNKKLKGGDLYQLCVLFPAGEGNIPAPLILCETCNRQADEGKEEEITAAVEKRYKELKGES